MAINGIRALRVQLGLRQYDLVRLTGISQSRLSLIENRLGNPPTEMELEKIKYVLGIEDAEPVQKKKTN